MDTEYVDADEFEALEALLNSAERKLDPGVAGCKRQAAVSPATLKLQEQHAADQAAHSNALFPPVPDLLGGQASHKQQLGPLLQQQHKQQPGAGAVVWPATSVPWVRQGQRQQQPHPHLQQRHQVVSQPQPPQHQQACEVRVQQQAGQHCLPDTRPGHALDGPAAAGMHAQGQHQQKQHHRPAHGPSLQDSNNPKWHASAQQQSRDMQHHLQQQGGGSISGAILPGSTAGSGGNSSGKAVTKSSSGSVPWGSDGSADAAAVGSANDAAKRTPFGPTAGASRHLPLHTNSRGSSAGNIPAETVAGKQTSWCSNASAVAPSADKAAGSSSGMCAPLACAAGTQGQPQALAPASSSGNAVAGVGSVQGSGAGVGNDACPCAGSSGGAHAQAVPGGNGAGAGPGPSSSLGAPAGAAVVNNSIDSKPAVGNSAGHGCQQVSGWSVQQQWSTAGGSSGVAAHQKSSSVAFGSGGNSRRYTGTTGSGAHTAGIKRSNSWSVGQWQQQQQQQGAAQVQQQSWHHRQQQVGPRHHQQPHQQQYGQAQQAFMAPPQQRQQQQQWQQHRQQHAQHGVQQQASPQVQQEVTAGHPGAPPQASPQIQQQQQQQAPGQCIQPVAPQQRQQQRQQQQQQLGGPVGAAVAAGGSGGMAWQGHASAAPCSGGAAMHSGLPNVPGRDSQQHGMQPAGSGGRSASAGPVAAAAAAGAWSGGSTAIAAPAAGAWSGGSNAIAGAAAAAAGAAEPVSGGGTIPAGPPPAGAAAGAGGGGSGGLSTNLGRRKLPSSLGSHGRRIPGSGGGGGGGSGGSARGAAGSGGVGGSGGYRPQQQQQQQQQQWGRPRGPKQLPWAGSVVYAHTPADVDYACKQMLAAGPPAVIGFDVEWKPSFTKGAPPNKAALIQLAYFCQGGQDCRTMVEDQGRGVIVLLLHIKHSGITKKLQEVLLDDQIVKLGVNIGGDVLKLGSDYNVQVFGALDLSDTAHGHQLRAVEGVTANVQPKTWSLAGLIDEVFSLELPKPQHIRMGDWERKPLTREQQRYAAMDAYACLLLHWELQNLPTKQTLQQRLIDAMRERAAGEDDSDDDEQ